MNGNSFVCSVFHKSFGPVEWQKPQKNVRGLTWTGQMSCSDVYRHIKVNNPSTSEVDQPL